MNVRLTIPTGEVTIRPYAVTDAQAVWEAVRESVNQLMPWMPWCHPDYSLEESRTWLETQVQAFAAKTAYEFAITSSDGRYIGGCGLNQIDSANRRANLGYWVRSTATGRGAATEAVRLIHRWAIDHTDLIRMEIVIAVGNLASQRVAEKATAVREGTLFKRLLLRGTPWDAVMFSLTR
jgi:RimJ/RimL family protein N-acetyltransferase